MIGIVIVTHGQLCLELAAALEHIAGPQAACRSVPIGPDDDMEERRQTIREAIQAVDQGQGVAVIADLFGGTPANLAISLREEGRVEVAVGASLPLLVSFAELRAAKPLETALSEAVEKARRHLAVAGELLRPRPKSAT